jgi:hypothetical protein
MASCPKCRTQLARIHRGPLDKLVYIERLRCHHCKLNLARRRPLLESIVSSLLFIYSRHTRCPKCRTGAVHRVPDWDRVDALSRNPLGLLQALLAAPMNYCSYCRLRYYDWRTPQPKYSTRSVDSTNENPLRQKADRAV